MASRKRRARVLKIHPVPSSRLITVVMLLCTALGGLGMRLAWLQLVAGEQLESRARQAQTERRNPWGAAARSSIVKAGSWPSTKSG